MSQEAFRILMVEDVTRYQKLYELAITEALNAAVDFAVDGEDAWGRITRQAPDLLLLDLNLPRLGGEEVLKRVRDDRRLDNMPVIILTGDGDQSTQSRLLEIGANDFIEKGASPELFVARLKAQVRHKLALDRLTRLAIDVEVLTAGVLHDIRNIESSVGAACEVAKIYLAEDPIARRSDIADCLTALQGQASKLGQYAYEVIQMVRETGGEAKLEAQSWEPLLTWVQDVLKQQDGGGLELSVLGTLAPVMADRQLLRLALLNILQNAVKYARPEARPKIIASQAQENGRLVTRFRDFGIGIKPEELRKVFEPFVRGSGTATQKKGFGLGLALVARVVRNMNGDVWAETPSDGVGAVIALAFPPTKT